MSICVSPTSPSPRRCKAVWARRHESVSLLIDHLHSDGGMSVLQHFEFHTGFASKHGLRHRLSANDNIHVLTDVVGVAIRKVASRPFYLRMRFYIRQRQAARRVVELCRRARTKRCLAIAALGSMWIKHDADLRGVIRQVCTMCVAFCVLACIAYVPNSMSDFLPHCVPITCCV